MTRGLVLAAAALLAAACTAGPDYRKPEAALPAEWKVEAPWRTANPSDDLAKGAWWTAFHDAELDALEEQAAKASPTLAIAEARLAQSRAALQAASASLWPQLGAVARAGRTRITENRPLSSYSSPNSSAVQDDFALGLSASYEADLAGRVRRTVEGARASAEQSAADLESTRLVVQADLATAYFGLRELDVEMDVIARSIATQRRLLEFTTERHDLGAASGIDVAQQQALLDSTLTQVDVLKRQRDQLEHAIATLTGTAAPLFALPASASLAAPPVFPVGVPSDVLERRPDVASAERAMAAANAQVGVASAALYPSITLGASYGAESRALSSLLDAPSTVWALGAALAQPVFDAGRIRANIAFSQAGYDATVASYRRTVLTAMQEVEDGISGEAALQRAHAQALAAVASARRVLDMAHTRYEAGAATYLEVITAQQALLNNERLAAQLLGQRFVGAVFLVKALGGGWEGLPKVAMGQR